MSLNLPLKSVLGLPKPSLGLTPSLPPSDMWPTRPDAFSAHYQHCWQLPGTQWTVLGGTYGARCRSWGLAYETRMLQTFEQSPHILAPLVVLSKDKIHGGTERQSLLSKVIQQERQDWNSGTSPSRTLFSAHTTGALRLGKLPPFLPRPCYLTTH